MNDQERTARERWLRGETDPDLEAAVVADPEAAEAAYADLALDAALSASAAGACETRRTRRWAWAGGLVAAALAWLVLVPALKQSSDESAVRLRSGGTRGAVTDLAPTGAVESFPRNFQWRAGDLAGDTRFRWELYDGAMHRRAVAIVADTILVRPPTDTPADSAGAWRWLVVPLLADGTEGVTSPAAEFTVEQGGDQ